MKNKNNELKNNELKNMIDCTIAANTYNNCYRLIDSIRNLPDKYCEQHHELLKLLELLSNDLTDESDVPIVIDKITSNEQNAITIADLTVLSKRRFDDACDVVNQPIMYLMSLDYCIISIDLENDVERYFIEMLKRDDDKKYYAIFDIHSEGGELIIFE
jgi:hypothetical protein